MLFSGEEGDKQTKALSGGEQARLIFCKLILTKPNILIFDEPTNHLDLEAINALNIALQRYEGTSCVSNSRPRPDRRSSHKAMELSKKTA
jgi:ATPase subunit of ABC transporter with duplicated ATPase domains